MRLPNVKVGQNVGFPIQVSNNGEAIFVEKIESNRYFTEIITLISNKGITKECFKCEGFENVNSYVVNENDLILWARKGSLGFIVKGYRVKRIDFKRNKSFGEYVFFMRDGYIHRGNIQDKFICSLLDIITKVNVLDCVR